MQDWIANLFAQPFLTRMGHGHRAADLNLGLGWVYYGLARALRPTTVVVIGSYRGFVPLVLGKALLDNEEKGEVTFIDPSLVDTFWQDAQAVQGYFAGLGVPNIRHYLLTTQQFVETAAYSALPPVGLVFVDGYHSAEQVRFDHEAFRDRLAPNAVVLFHDSGTPKTTRMYGPERAYRYSVREYLEELKQDARLQVFDLPLAAGVTLVRRAEG